MVKAHTVDRKISASKKVIKKELKRQSAKNTKQDAEIAKLKGDIEKLKQKKASKRIVSEYNLFIRKQILSGLSFAQAVRQWNKYKALLKKKSRKLSAYNQFIGSQMRLGKTFTQAVALWKLAKAGKLGKKGSVRTVTKTVVKRVKSKPKIITKKGRTKVVTRFAPAASSVAFNISEIKSAIEKSHFSKSELKDAMGPDDEEIAFKIMQTYFIEVARLGFKRRLTLDEIIDAYFYSLARVKMKDSAGVLAKNSFVEAQAKK